MAVTLAIWDETSNIRAARAIILRGASHAVAQMLYLLHV